MDVDKEMQPVFDKSYLTNGQIHDLEFTFCMNS